MHSLTICFGPSATVWTLLFKEGEKAREMHDGIASAGVEGNSVLSVTDDFGQQVSVRVDQVHGMMLEDMSLSSEARIERGLDQARSQAIAQKRGMADPVISASLRQQQMGPAVYQPNMPRGMM